MTAQGEQNEGVWPYLGVGCLTAVAGGVGGGMLAVMLAKIVGALMRCAPDSQSGAPCGWTTYWMAGALVGLVLLPTISILRMRRSRATPRDTDRR